MCFISGVSTASVPPNTIVKPAKIPTMVIRLNFTPSIPGSYAKSVV